jgi:hypothetical protein
MLENVVLYFRGLDEILVILFLVNLPFIFIDLDLFYKKVFHFLDRFTGLEYHLILNTALGLAIYLVAGEMESFYFNFGFIFSMILRSYLFLKTCVIKN